MLTATRSLSDVKNEPSPYRMSEEGALPKFGPRKKASAASPPPHVGGYKTEQKENLGEGSGDRTDAGCSLKSESSRKPEGLAGWLRGRFSRKPRRERREPVQAEFALDLVKVVRNDLSDADETRVPKPEKSTLKREHQQGELQPEETVFSVPVR